MSIKNKVILLTLIIAIPAFLLGRVIWPDPAGAMPPTAGQLPFFMVLSVFDALTFGLGISFIVFGWPWAKKSKAEFIALAWLIVSWWPHDNWHRYNGMNLQGLLYIEYAFHVTLMIAALVVIWAWITRLRAISLQ